MALTGEHRTITFRTPYHGYRVGQVIQAPYEPRPWWKALWRALTRRDEDLVIVDAVVGARVRVRPFKVRR